MPANTNGARVRKRAIEKPFAFVSYAHKDGRMVRSSIAYVKNAGYNFWIDSGIEVSATWSDEIAKAIIECAVFVVFISKTALKSGFVRKEIEFAVQKEKTIVPIYLDAIEILPPGLELWLNGTQGAIAENMSAKEISEQIIVSLERNGVRARFTKKAAPRFQNLISMIAVVVLLLCAAIGALFVYNSYKNTAAKNTQINAPKIENKISAENTQKPIEVRQPNIEKKPAENSVKTVDKTAEKKVEQKSAVKDQKTAVKQNTKTAAKTTAQKSDTKSAKAQIVLQKTTFKAGEKAKISVKNSKNSRTIALYKFGDNMPIIIKAITNAKAEIIMPKSVGKYELKLYNSAQTLTAKTLTAQTTITVRGR